MGWLSNLFTDEAVLKFEEYLKELASADNKQKQEIYERCMSLLKATRQFEGKSGHPYRNSWNAILHDHSQEAFDFLVNVTEEAQWVSTKGDAISLLTYWGPKAIDPFLKIVCQSTDLELVKTAIWGLLYYPSEVNHNNPLEVLDRVQSCVDKRPLEEQRVLDEHIMKGFINPYLYEHEPGKFYCEHCHQRTLVAVGQDSNILPAPPGTNWAPLLRKFNLYKCSNCGWTFRYRA